MDGKVQRGMHDVLSKLKVHSGLLSMLPSQEKYLSVVTGAMNTLIKVGSLIPETSQKWIALQILTQLTGL